MKKFLFAAAVIVAFVAALSFPAAQAAGNFSVGSDGKHIRFKT